MIDTAVVLAGGLGTRLRPITYEIPKPLIPLQGRPIVWYTLELLRRQDITNIILVVGYKAEQFRETFGDGKIYGMDISYLLEDRGTGGALSHLFLDKTFVYCNGDEIKDINIRSMYEQHGAWQAKGTIALTRVEHPEEYGVPIMNDNKIAQFLEKPNHPPSNLVNAGLYLFEPDVISLAAPESSIEHDVLPALARSGSLFGYESLGQWFDTGTWDRYEKARNDWKGFKDQ